MKTSILIWIVRVTATIILLQTLYFKFTGAEESIYIFSALGIEPYGRIGSGIVELITCVLILIPGTTLWGALIGAAVMLGAIFSHIFVLGIEVKNDGGLLFTLAIIVFICCLALIYLNKSKISNLLKIKL